MEKIDKEKRVDWDSQSLYTAAILENGGPNRIGAPAVWTFDSELESV